MKVIDFRSIQSPTISRIYLLSLVIVFALVWFSNLEHRKLINPDEGRYAEIAREMAVSGDWVTPRLNGLKYFEKPPLQYWATAAAFKLFGEHQWTARWWPATTAFACVLLMFWVGRRLYGEEVGLAAAVALGGCSGFLISAHINTLDAGLAAFLTVALLSFLMAQHVDATPRENCNWMLVVWAALALAILSKGLVGVVLPGAVLTLYILIERDWRMLTRLHLGKGLVLFLLIAAPWFVAVSLANDEFVRFFFIHEHFARFLTKVHRRPGAWWYFVPILLFGIMPWLPFIAVRLRDSWRRENEPGVLQPLRLLMIWAGFIFVFFSASSSKLPFYILPVFPALALFTAIQMQQITPKILSRLAWGLVTAGSVLLLVVLSGGEHIVQRFANDSSPIEIIRRVVPWVQVSVAVFTVSALAAAWLFRRYARSHGVVALALGSLSAGILAMDGHDEVSRLSSTYHIVHDIETTKGALDCNAPFYSEALVERWPALFETSGSLDCAIPFYSIQMHDQTLPFYLKRPVTLVQYVDEFALGLEAEPQKGIETVEDWQKRWIGLDQGYAIMNPANYERFTGEGLPMRVLARDPRRVIVSRR